MQAAIEHSSYSPIRKVECDFDDGSLTLRGQVPSYFLKQIATELAKSAGAVIIRNRIIVI